MFEHVVDSYPETNKPLSAKYTKCFAHPTFKERIPSILQAVIEDLKNKNEIKSKYGENAVKEIDSVVEKIQSLKNGMSVDQALTEVNTSGPFSLAATIYNKEINQRQIENAGKPPSWFQTEWLFAECYCYFKLAEIFYTSAYLTKHDPFLKVKVDSLRASKTPILQLSKYIVKNRPKWAATEEEKKATFTFLLKCSLWGNKADLSLSGGKAVAAQNDIYSEMNTLDKNIIVNDLEEVYQLLIIKRDQIFDVVLDNAGYELFNDLCFADYLLHAGFAKKVIFHGKSIPWFVSDVTPLDFHSILGLLSSEFKSEHVTWLIHDWTNYLKNGQWEFKAESFWITPYDYSKMSTVDPQLYAALSCSNLVIFKGDLNYRKLVGDIYWEPTITFKAALRGFEPTNLLALRTIKADTLSGLKKSLFEDLTQNNPKWSSTGKYALLQLLKK